MYDPVMQPQFRMLRHLFPKEKLSLETGQVTLVSLAALIPARPVCEIYLANYLRYFESLYPVFSVPSLLLQWEDFWKWSDKGDERSQDPRMGLIPRVALVIAIGSRLENFRGSESSTLAFDPRKLLSMVDTYLILSNSRAKPSIEILQTQVLLVLSKRLFSAPSIAIWRATGDLLRVALAMGLNENPRGHAAGDVHHEVQLRRRLWYTIANLELDASLRCGMPSLLQGLTTHCERPASDATGLAHSQDSVDDRLRAAFQNLAIVSFRARLDAVRGLTTSTPDPKDIRDRLSHLHSIRIDMKAEIQAAEQSVEDNQLCNAVMLEFLLLQPIILLHTLALQLPSSSTASAISFMDCLPACLRALGQLEALNLEQTQFESITNPIPWKLAWAFFGDDLIRAAYTACFFVKRAALKQPVFDQSTRECMIGISDIPSSNVKRVIWDMIKTFLTLAPNPWTWLKQIMGLAMCTEAMNQCVDASRREELMMKSLQRVIDFCREKQDATNSSTPSTDFTLMLEPFGVNTGRNWFDDLFPEDSDLYSAF
jgi:hypothetical protein